MSACLLGVKHCSWTLTYIVLFNTATSEEVLLSFLFKRQRFEMLGDFPEVTHMVVSGTKVHIGEATTILDTFLMMRVSSAHKGRCT